MEEPVAVPRPPPVGGADDGLDRDRHDRYFLRLISRRTLLYTEMVPTGAVLRSGDPARFLRFDPAERPVALQLGGCDPDDLAHRPSCGRHTPPRHPSTTS